MTDPYCDLNDFINTIAHCDRRSVLLLLCQREMSVSELCEHFAMPQPTVSHHLALLRYSRLVSTHRDGTRVFYRANRDCIARCIHELESLFGLDQKMNPNEDE